MVTMHTPILSTAEKAAQDGLRKGLKVLLDRARELSPTDTGDSDKSGFVAIDDLTGQVGFRSFISMLQHEHIEWQHTGGGQAKFLEAAAAEVDVSEYVFDEIRKAFS